MTVVSLGSAASSFVHEATAADDRGQPGVRAELHHPGELLTGSEAASIIPNINPVFQPKYCGNK